MNNNLSFQLNDYIFNLPPELIARYPLTCRTESKLMCVTGTQIEHRRFDAVLDLVQPGDLLVFNDTKVIPARLYGQKQTGGRVEVLVERVLDTQRILVQMRVSKSPQPGDELLFGENIRLRVIGRQGHFYELSNQSNTQTILEVIELIGQIPLPPYLNREAEESDKERYQTVYAKHKGSAAAPTAGFHFDERLLQAIKQKGVESAYVTLHIGAGTFLPVRTEDIREHKMHSEYIDVPASVAAQVKATQAKGKRVIAVGTTTLRALESASANGDIAPYQGDTSIFIYPGYQFKTADILITNLHLPGSSLIMLVAAFAGHEHIMKAYQEAVAKSYRFYSYGDAMWLARA
jgi:S-adenosylmethionine:tRNA ribosyltransferase-isomerase